MKRKWALVLSCGLVAFLLVVAADGVWKEYKCSNWECDGTIDCDDEMADECRTYRDTAPSPDNWKCTGHCWLSDDSGTVKECTYSVWHNKGCEYSGPCACGGNIQYRNCKTQSAAPASGVKCVYGDCTGIWNNAPPGGCIVDCANIS